MFCEKCGAENPNDSKFCQKCGAPLTPIASETGATAPKAKKPLNMKLILGLVLAAAVIIAGVVIINNLGRTIDLNKYVIVEAKGYDGYGNAGIGVDWKAIKEKYSKKISFTSEAKKQLGGLFELGDPVDLLENYVGIRAEKNRELSNGDKIEYEWKINEDYVKYFNCKLKFKNDFVTVEGLKDIETFDAFADLEVSFSGMAPNGRVSYNNNNENNSLPYNFFECEKTDGLKNGDTVEIKVNADAAEYYIQSNGKKPAEKSKTYTVSGLPEYIENFSMLDTDFVSTLKKETEDTILAYVANNYSDKASLNNLEFAGYLFTTVSDMSRISDGSNGVFMIYKGDVSHSEGLFNTAKVYFPVYFNGLVKTDGATSYRNKGGIYGYSSLDGRASTNGYVNPLTCYLELAQNFNDSYTLEAGAGFETYSKYEEIKTLDGISADYKNALYLDTKAQIEKYVADNYNEESKLEDLEPVGEILLTAKEATGDFRRNTRYFVVYAGTVSNERAKIAPTKVYFPVEYLGMFKLGNGDYTITDVNGIQGSASFEGTWYYTRGYIDGKKLYSDIVTGNRERYNFEVSDGIAALETAGSEGEQ